MPVLKPRHDHVKVWRPTGTLYVEADVNINSTVAISMAPHIAAGIAVDHAFHKFVIEFRRPPDPSRLIVEVVFSGAHARATIYELPEAT